MTAPIHLFLTGGTGFFGRALLRYWLAEKNKAATTSPLGEKAPLPLRERGWGEGGRELLPIPDHVTVLSRNPQGFLAHHPEFADLPWLHWHWGDMLLPASLPAPVAFPHTAKTPPADTAFSHILHAACDSTHGAQLAPLQRYNQITQGTRHLLEWAAAQGQHHGRMPRLLYISSGAVYGVQPKRLERMPENYHGMPDPLDTSNAYGIAKRCAEHLCSLYAQQHGMEVVIARCFAFVGQDLPRDVHFAIGNFIRDALERPAITVQGDGTPLRSYMDQRDLAHWLTTLLVHGRAGQAYNVGSEAAISMAQTAVQVRNLLAPGKPIHMQEGSNNAPQRLRYLPDTRKAREELGLTQRYGLLSAVHEAAGYSQKTDIIP